MLKKQNNKCLVCERSQSDFKTNFCVDHNHKTGRVRGLLCISCNRLVGEIENGKAEKAKKYLTKSSI
jgi:hypothetical protein